MSLGNITCSLSSAEPWLLYKPALDRASCFSMDLSKRGNCIAWKIATVQPTMKPSIVEITHTRSLARNGQRLTNAPRRSSPDHRQHDNKRPISQSPRPIGRSRDVHAHIFAIERDLNWTAPPVRRSLNRRFAFGFLAGSGIWAIDPREPRSEASIPPWL